MEKYQLRSMTHFQHTLMCLTIIILMYIGYIVSQVDKNSLYIFIPILVGFTAYIVSNIIKDYKKKGIIDELVGRDDYRYIVVAGIDERSTNGKYPKPYYVYICEDPDTDIIYESEWIFDIEGSDIKMGDQVRLYESHTEKDIYWVDINHRESGKGLKKLSEEAKEFGESSFEEFNKNAQEKEKSKPLMNVALLFGMLFIVALSSLGSSLLKYGGGLETTSRVEKVESRNSTCGRKPIYTCTVYDTTFLLDEFPMVIIDYPQFVYLRASSAKGENQPITLSKYQVGERINLLVRRDKINDGLIFDGVYVKESLLRTIKIQKITASIFGILTAIFFGLYWNRKQVSIGTNKKVI